MKINKILLIIFLLAFKSSIAKNIWIGEWLASDQWQSEFLISINKDGTANSGYGDGETGKWKVIDGNLNILWDSGKSDYFFSGVMGYQRIHRNKAQSYTSGLRKSAD